eukprot:GHVP01020663.1.p1 GENE.GHVP01020663.1~~GHVP01020663.1.p1  ORF type:complete len:289 (-),score=30.72 GHVP01020663.1:975-1814(-)
MNYGCISNSERQFLSDGLLQGIRLDGRKLWDVRPYSCVEKGVLNTCWGSSRLLQGKTEILVGVKVEVVPKLDPNAGRIIVGCTLPSHTKESRKEAEEWGQSLASVFQRMLLNPDCINPKDLKIGIDGEFFFAIFVDALVLSYSDTVLFDCISVALLAALEDTRLPNVNIVRVNDLERDEDARLDYEVNPDSEHSLPIKTEDIPLLMTIGQISGVLLWQMDALEQLASDAEFLVAIKKSGVVCGLSILGAYPVDQSRIRQIVERAAVAGKSLHSQLLSQS